MKKLLPQTLHSLLTDKDLETEKSFASFLDKVSDIASSKSLSKQSITSSGIYNQQAIVTIRDFESQKEFIPVFCEINIGVEVKENRGVHMSRYSQSLFELSAKKYDDLSIFAEELAKHVKSAQKSTSAYVEVSGTYLHKKYTKKSKLLSSDKLYLVSKVAINSNNTSVQTGMTVFNITACPCTKAYTKYMIAPKLKTMGLNTEQINEVLEAFVSATHTQRGTTTLLIDKEKSNITHKDIYKVLDKSTHLIYDLLKRPDEHDLVIRAVQKPQFTEDVAREVADTAYEQFNNLLSKNATLYVESILNDSIHIHDVRTVIEKTFGEIQQELNA